MKACELNFLTMTAEAAVAHVEEIYLIRDYGQRHQTAMLMSSRFLFNLRTKRGTAVPAGGTKW
jgi:hypothetical protein